MTEFSIEPNPQCVYAHRQAQERNRASDIGKYRKRTAFIELNHLNHLNPNRFENINRSPDCHTMNKNKPTTYFKKQSPRKLKETLLPVRPFQNDNDTYASIKDSLMQQLTHGYVDMEKHEVRDDWKGGNRN